MKKYFAVYLLFFILGGLSVFAFLEINKSQQNIDSVKSIETARSSVEEGATSDFKTFSDNEFGFEFDYPSSLYINKIVENETRAVWALTQEDTPPAFGFEDICGESKSYVDVQASRDWKSTYVFSKYKNSDELVSAFETDFDRGEKISDKTIDGIRFVKFQKSSRVLYDILVGSDIFSFHGIQCDDTPLQFNDIVESFRAI